MNDQNLSKIFFIKVHQLSCATLCQVTLRAQDMCQVLPFLVVKALAKQWQAMQMHCQAKEMSARHTSSGPPELITKPILSKIDALVHSAEMGVPNGDV